MKRSEFLKGLIGVVAAAGLPPALASDEPRRIGTSTVEECRQALGRLYTLDGQHGSGNLYAVSTYMIERLHRLLDRASYSIETGDELRRVTAAVVENTGWVAFDGGRNDLARQWWLEAIHAADLADDVETRSVVLLSMAMAEANFGSGREAVHLVEATRSAVGSPSPRLASLLSAREALGHGRMGDRAAVARAMTASRALLQRGPSAADPGWIGFWNGADLASHEAKAFRLAGHHRGAELAAREAVTLADATVPRNAAFYRCQLSEVLAEHGDLDEAMALARPLVLGVRSESRRVQRMLDGTVTAIGRRGPQRGAEFARWAEVVAS
ncbi:hypothetical protein [Cryptosporangium sp. NPDC051539]|uniref:hypothetical protein n=1 Tax=Cryptosporangium sp. NPDC051539 TaxID=3363962 RepID=UPI0037982A9A